MKPLAFIVLASCASASAERASGGEAVLAKYCVKCHGPTRAESDFGFATDTAKLVANGLVVPGDPDGSIIVRRIELGEMPPSGARPSKAELGVLRAWVAGLPKQAPVRGDQELARLLATDAAQLDRTTRANARWFTLGHLANAGVPGVQLEAYRKALAILLGSLSWAPAPRAAIAVDPERTVFRIDLRELGWTAATWDAIRARYPYGLARSRGVPDSVRADWFVATASRGALYHEILALPDTEAKLARLLDVDLVSDLAAERIVRAGFNNSGVSVNNRVIERHTTRFGAYWRSYDFASSIGFENVFAHPFDFVPAGGEIIFNLPNGLQAYMLVDATGKRIDKAPTAIVSDPRRPDRAVENALSCIGCHASGIVDRADQIRPASRDPRVERLHPSIDEMANIYAIDRARFTRGLARVGAAPPGDLADEPITLLATRYEADLDLRLAAAELGLEPDELASRLERSRDLTALRGRGGTIKRDTWAGAFSRIATALGVGVPFTPRPGDPGPELWIDAARRTWLVAGRGLDRDRAVAACRAQRLELPATDELITAASTGLAAGLRVTGSAWTRESKLDVSNQRYAIVVELATATRRRASPSDQLATVCIQRDR
ncbi:MAG: c-type cytochrome domain-containing protein [Kofleriaceae bacterium]